MSFRSEAIIAFLVLRSIIKRHSVPPAVVHMSDHLMAMSHFSPPMLPFRHLCEADHAGLKGKGDVQV